MAPGPSALERDSHSEAETEALGEALGGALEAGDVVALTGPLGAGKTRFTVGVARGAGCRSRVRSPSFAIVNQYAGRVRLAHLDLYRLAGGDVEDLGLEELCESAAVVVEWGERLPARWRAEALEVTIEPAGEGTRRVRAAARSGRARELLAAWSAALAARAFAAPPGAAGAGR